MKLPNREPVINIGIEGIPFIIRFKTEIVIENTLEYYSIEGIPFIIRFKTLLLQLQL